jgi:hypothetical protein
LKAGILPNSVITIGNLELDGFEIPEALRFGGRQRLAIHTLAGGKRVVERLGPDDDEVQFRGTFSGPNAEGRVRAFEELRISGEIVWLTWASFRRQVIVKRFAVDYANPSWIHYEISCVTARVSRLAPSNLALAALSLAADFARAMAMADALGISLSPLQSAVFLPNAFTAGTADQNAALAEIDGARHLASHQIEQQSGLLTSPIPSGSDFTNTSQSYVSRVANAGSLAAASNIDGYIGRMGANLRGMG